MSWWESTVQEGLTIHFVPAQHWTRRTLEDMNTSHWEAGFFKMYMKRSTLSEIQAILMDLSK